MLTAVTALALLATIVEAYFFGCINGALLVSKLAFHDDIRAHGSGNAGLTNFYRTYGVHGVIGVLASDILKAVLAVLIGGVICGALIGQPVFGKYLGLIFVLVGHIYPVTFGFRGGKGVLSAISAVIAIDWRIALVLLGIFVVVVLLTRYVSLGSVCAALGVIPTFWVATHSLLYVIMTAIPAVLVVFAHRSNIVRLVHGQENRFSLHKKKEESR